MKPAHIMKRCSFRERNRTMSHSRQGLLLAIAFAAASGTADAAEGLIPYLPGVTTGVPVGALPPPGFYGINNDYVVFGKVRDDHGNVLPITVDNYSESGTFLWSSPYHVLGAQYGAGLIQISASHNVDAREVGGGDTSSFGFFNTILQPVVLSWTIDPHLFVSTAQTVYLKDGEFHASAGVRDQTSYANNYWTYEPSVAVSYLRDGWDLTGNFLCDFNTIDHKTDYLSGSTFYADLTATKKVGHLDAGLVGAVVQQTTDDHRDGAVFDNGNRVSHLMIGPLLSYEFPRFSITARYFSDLRSRNDVNLSIAYLTVNFKF